MGQATFDRLLEQYQSARKEHQKNYQAWADQLSELPEGEHEIVVTKVVWKGVYYLDGSMSVIVQDREGRLIEIPESALQGAIVTRHDIHPGMKIKIVVMPHPFTARRPSTLVVTAQVLSKKRRDRGG